MKEIQQTAEKRFAWMVKNRMNVIFKTVLTTVENEAKNYDVKLEFFNKGERGKETGFAKIRKTLLRQGNDLIQIADIILSQSTMIPNKSIMTFKDDKKKENVSDKD